MRAQAGGAQLATCSGVGSTAAAPVAASAMTFSFLTFLPSSTGGPACACGAAMAAVTTRAAASAARMRGPPEELWVPWTSTRRGELLLQRRLVRDLLQRLDRRSVQHAPVDAEPRSVARAVPRPLGVVEPHRAAEVCAPRGHGMDAAGVVAVGGAQAEAGPVDAGL